MLIILSLLLLALLGILFEKKNKFEKHFLFWFFSTMYFFFFFIIPIMKYGQDGFNNVELSSSRLGVISDQTLIANLFIYQIIFYFFFLIGYFCIKSRPMDYYKKPIYFNLDRLVLLFVIISIIGSIGNIYFSGMSISQLLTSSRFEYWQTKSEILFLLSSYFQMTLMVPMFLYKYIKNKKLQFLILGALLLLFYVKMVIFGSRMPLIYVGGAYIIGFLCYKNECNLKIHKIRAIIMGMLCFHVMVSWQYIRYNSRSYVDGSEWVQALFNFSESYNLSLSRGDLTYFFDASATVFNIIPSYHDYIYGDSYLRAVLFFVPHSLFRNKPEETQRLFAKIINPASYEIGATFPPSLIGDSYLNFGYFGILVGLLLGLLLKYWQGVLNRGLGTGKIVIGASCFGFLILFLRGTMNGMYILIFIWLSMLLSVKFLKLKENKANYQIRYLLSNNV